MAVELNKFDMSRLPIKWDQVDPEKMQQAIEAINASTKQQCEELQAKKTAEADTPPSTGTYDMKDER